MLGPWVLCTMHSGQSAPILVVPSSYQTPIPMQAIPSPYGSPHHLQAFRNDIMEATNGIGVDLVFNSPSGELLHSSWECVAPYGAMVGTGKRDLIGRGQLVFSPYSTPYYSQASSSPWDGGEYVDEKGGEAGEGEDGEEA